MYLLDNPLIKSLKINLKLSTCHNTSDISFFYKLVNGYVISFPPILDHIPQYITG